MDVSWREDAGESPRARAPRVARLLGGDLRCVRCGYNLRGLSVLGACAECGLPVRYTLLAIVDPHASELRPLRWPRLTATGLVLWAAAGLGAAACAWWPRIADVAVAAGFSPPALDALVHLGAALLLLSMLGATVLVRPHAGLRRIGVASAATAAVLYLPLAWAFWRMHRSDAAFDSAPFLDAMRVNPARTALRIAQSVLLAGIVVGLREHARLLATRSMLLRTGRVDRQTMLLMAGVLGVITLGDLLRLASMRATGIVSDAASVAGTSLIGVGSMVFTIGLVGVLIDTIRIAPALLQPAPSLDDVLGEDDTMDDGGPP